MDSSELGRKKTLEKLESDLSLGELGEESHFANLRAACGEFKLTADLNNLSVLVDLATSFGAVGAWSEALQLIEKIRDFDIENPAYRIFQMQCYLKLGRFHDVLLLAQAAPWPRSELIHVNYLMGCAFYETGLKDQARKRFEAVKKQDPHYSDILLKLQET